MGDGGEGGCVTRNKGRTVDRCDHVAETIQQPRRSIGSSSSFTCVQ